MKEERRRMGQFNGLKKPGQGKGGGGPALPPPTGVFNIIENDDYNDNLSSAKKSLPQLK